MKIFKGIKLFFLKKDLKTELNLILDNIVIFSGIFLSRLTGFLRDIMFAYIFGVSTVSDAFLAASKLPNSFRRIFADGGLLISFIPVFVKEREKNQEEALKFAGRILTLISIIVLVFVILCCIFMPMVIKIVNPGFIQKKELLAKTVKFGRISIFFLFVATVSSLMCGILNGIRKFFYNAYNTVIYNAVLIAACFISLFFLEDNLEEKAFFVSFALIIAGIFSAIFVWIGLKKNKLYLKPRKPFFNKQEKEVLSGIFYSIFSFIKVLLDSVFASFFFGGISFLYFADRIVNFPTSLIGYTLSASILPILSKHFSLKDRKEFTKILFFSFRFISILTIPVIFALYFFSDDIVYFVYGNSKMTNENLQVLSKILKISSFSIIFQIISKVLTSAFFASSNQRMSFVINISSLSVNAILILLLSKKYDIYSLFISNLIINILNFIIMFGFLYKKKTVIKLYDKDLLFDIIIASFAAFLTLLITKIIFLVTITSKFESFKKILFFLFIYCIIIIFSFALKNIKRIYKLIRGIK